MEKDYPIKIVQGNYFAIALPLSKIVWSNGSKTEQPLVPNKGDLITVNLVSSSRRYDMRKIYVQDNVVHYECNEYLDLGTYSIELRLILVDGKKYRSYQRNKIQIVATNEEADIKDGNEFDVDTYEISSAVILYAKGDKGDKGDRGPAGPVGPRGFDGHNGKDGKDGVTDYNELQNIPTFKTINGETITGEGDIVIEGGEGGGGDMSNYYTKTESDARYLPINTPIPSEVTESTVSGWGFTKNTGNYNIPSNGIPKTDLSQGVQDSLALADSALQTQAQADWNQTDITKLDYIKNKPSDVSVFTNDVGYITNLELLEYATKDWVSEQISESGSFDPSLYYTKNDIDEMDFASSTDLNDYALKTELFSGSYTDLIDKPIIPTKISDLPNDAEYATMAYVDNMIGSISLITDLINGEII